MCEPSKSAQRAIRKSSKDETHTSSIMYASNALIKNAIKWFRQHTTTALSVRLARHGKWLHLMTSVSMYAADDGRKQGSLEIDA